MLTCGLVAAHVYVGSVTARLDDVLQRFSHVLCLQEELPKPLETSSLIQNSLMFYGCCFSF